MSWYIGQRIVAIVSHPVAGFKKGDEFVIKGLRKCVCKCDDVEIDIGHQSPPAIMYAHKCMKCGFELYESDPTHWLASRRFAPLDEWHEAEKAVKELLEPQKIEI